MTSALDPRLPLFLPGAAITVQTDETRPGTPAELLRVETYWRSDGTAIHMYGVRRPGGKRLRWISESDIVEACADDLAA